MGSDFGAVAPFLGGGNGGRYGGFNLGHVLEQFLDLAGFPSELLVVGQVLVLAATALTE